MNAYISGITSLIIAAIASPAAIAMGHFKGNSITVLANDNTHARDCYQSATIAARINYTSRRELENCDIALGYTVLSLHDRAATLANRGIIYVALEEYQQAIQDYTAALALKPDFGELYVNIGNIYFMGLAYDKAVTEYTTAIEKQTSQSYIAYMNRGMAYENLGNLAEAEKDISMALQLQPEWEMAKTKLAEVQTKMRSPAPAAPAVNP